MTLSDEDYMRRCFDLACLGTGRVSPNPPVGAVLLHADRLIGEGFHRRFGDAHAEVNALRSVAPADRPLIPSATLYVSLEPCCFFGKTPPCTDLIISQGIRRVVVSCLDDTPEVAGKGVEQLRRAGVEVKTGVLEEEGRRLSRPRSVYVLERRPYVILKFARSRDGFLAAREERRIWITNPFSRRLVHRWRGEADAILVGTRTARIDNPELTNRLYFGSSPLRIVLDRRLSLSPTLHLFQGAAPTLVVTERPPAPAAAEVKYLTLDFGRSLLMNLLRELHGRRIGVLLVEGGSRLLSSFLEEGLWDEARVFTGPGFIPDGLPAPEIGRAPAAVHQLANDELAVYYRDEG